MNRTNITRVAGRLALIAGVLIAGGLLWAGCFKADINVPEYAQYIPNGNAPAGQPAPTQIGGQDRALRLARQRASDEGLRPDDYNLAPCRSGEDWLVTFDSKARPQSAGYPHRFIVRVNLDGSTQLLR